MLNKKIKTVVVLALSVLFVVGCGDDSDKQEMTENLIGEESAQDAFTSSAEKNWSVSIIWDKALEPGTATMAHVHFKDGSGTETMDAQLTKFMPMMPSMGHGSDMSAQEIMQMEGGMWMVKGINFNMGGKWVVEIDATVAGKADSAVVTLDEL